MIKESTPSLYGQLVEMAKSNSFLAGLVHGTSVYTVDELIAAGLRIEPSEVPIIELPNGTKVVAKLMIELGDDCKPAGLKAGVCEVSRVLDPQEDLLGALDWWYNPNAWSTGRVWSSNLAMSIDADPERSPVLLLGVLTADEILQLAEHELPED